MRKFICLNDDDEKSKIWTLLEMKKLREDEKENGVFAYDSFDEWLDAMLENDFEEKQLYLQTNAVCPHCKKMLMTSDIESYPFVCLECDENFYGIEISSFRGDYCEISVPMKKEEWTALENDINIKFKDIADRITYDEYAGDNIGCCDIGFMSIPNSEEVQQIVKYFNEESKG